jgi:hypothetical protein
MCYYNAPKKTSSTGFVFICPGSFEEKASRPCAKQTGVVAELGIGELSTSLPKVFPYRDRYDYLITNAWPNVEYPKKTNRSVPTKDEVLDAKNLERLHAEIKGLHTVVVCGKLAHEAVRACVKLYNFKGKVAYVKHTSRRAIGCPTNENLPAVMRTWADDVIKQII